MRLHIDKIWPFYRHIRLQAIDGHPLGLYITCILEGRINYLKDWILGADSRHSKALG